MATVITPAEFAEIVESDGRTVRKFLRANTPKEEQPGKGSRWQLDGTKRGVDKLRRQFNEWSTAQAEKAAEKEQPEPELEPEPEDEMQLDD